MVSLVKTGGRHRSIGIELDEIFVTDDGCVMRREGDTVTHITECLLPDW